MSKVVTYNDLNLFVPYDLVKTKKGCKGRVMGWNGQTEKYIVEFSSGVRNEYSDHELKKIERG